MAARSEEQQPCASLFVRAEHSYSGAETASLSFKEGDIIEVISRHESGWHYGLLCGSRARGWIPSNYCAPATQEEIDWAKEQRQRHTMEALSTPSAPVRDSHAAPTALTTTNLAAVESAVDLLRHAVDAKVPAHFQPSTACIISAIRALLSASNCLTRESESLERHPALARERKEILSGLASLVTQARKSSHPDMGDEDRQAEINLMLSMAFQVEDKVRCFLVVAQQYNMQTFATEETATDLPARRQRHLLKAKSTGDFRRAHSSSFLRAPRSPATPSTSTASSRSPVWTLGQSAASSTSSLELPSSTQTPDAGEARVAHADVSVQLSLAHDQLLSVVAAFIGHVHCHSRAAHASSFAHLIDVTVEITEKVRDVLVLVESCEERSQDLEIARSAVYTATSSLVSAARAATNLPASSTWSSDTDEDEKQQLLSSATAVLRASNACVSAFRNGGSDSDAVTTASAASAASSSTRTRHTLSMLGRKTSTLAFLRQTLSQEPSGAGVTTSEGVSHQGTLKRHSRGTSTASESLSARRGVAALSPLLHVRSLLEAAGPVESAERAVEAGADLVAIDMTKDASYATHESLGKTSSTASMDFGSEDAPPSSASSLASFALPEKAESASSPSVSLNRCYAPSEICFNNHGQVMGGTLKSLVERLTLHDAIVDSTFANTFFLTFRLWTTPEALCQALIARWDVCAPHFASEAEQSRFAERWVLPIRLRVYNALRTLLEQHWRPATDSMTLDMLHNFATKQVAQSMSAPATQRLLDLLEKRGREARGAPHANDERLPKRAVSSERLRSSRSTMEPMTKSSAANAPPAPLVSRNALAALRSPVAAFSVHVTDIDATELARQLTILCSKHFCAIRPDDLLSQDPKKKGAAASSNLRIMSTLNTRITGWIAETILQEQDTKCRTQLLKYFIKVADRCASLQNYDSLMAILAALNSSMITRLHKTWQTLSNKYRTIIEALRKVVDHSRNFAEYRAVLRNAVPPALPFLGLYLTDLTFAYEGNSAMRSSPLNPSTQLVNFVRYQHLARIVTDIQRFQAPFSLIELPEMQSWLGHNLAGLATGDVESLYRKSLLLEPRTRAAESPVLQTTINF